jgi:hypothetical protein
MISTYNKLVILNSKFGIQQNGTYKSDLLFNFRNLLQDEENIIKSEILVVNAQFPASFYCVNEYNNTLILNRFFNPPLSITIEKGNYNANTLITELKAKFLLGGVIISSIVINRATGKLVFTMETVIDYSFSGSFIDILGTRTDVFSSGLVYSCIYPLNLLGIQKLSIQSEKLSIQSVSSYDFSLSNTLLTIPVDVSPFSLLNYISQSDSNKNLLNVRSINEIDIQIYDENENLVNFNNLDWTITLIISSEVKQNIRNLELTFNNTLNNNLLRLKKSEIEQPAEIPEEIQPPEDPIKLQNLKELEILNS